MLIPAFRIPTNIAIDQQVKFCLGVINKYRLELVPLRRMYLAAKKKIENLEQEIKKHIDDCKRLKIRIKKFQQDVDRLEKEKADLEKEIRRITTTNKRLSTALFDHGNLKTKPAGSDKKTKGGQKRHTDTNREAKEDRADYPKKRLHLTHCPHCHHRVNRTTATNNKTLIDIVINPEVVKYLLQLERQWCGNCHKEVKATHPQSLPFGEYGINTLMVILLLRFKGHLSLSRISLVLDIAFGLPLATSSVQAILSTAKTYLDDRYQELVKEVREGNLMYNDETGWLIGKKSAWLWIMANQEATVYYAAESRGNGIFKEMYGNSKAHSMHDGLASYESAVGDSDKHAYCWAHFLRFVHEETGADPPGSEAQILKDKIVDLYKLKDKLAKPQLEIALTEAFTKILETSSTHPGIIHIQGRLRKQQQGLIKALLLTPDGTNNLAERELRPLVILRKTTYGSNTFDGMEITATLGSVIQTLGKQPLPFLPTLKNYIQTGITKKHPTFVYS